MIYTERSKLTILNLSCERDVVTFDELKVLLAERPTNVIYVEKGEKLYGIISMGDIERAKENKRSFVNINVHFTMVKQGEYIEVKQIFMDKKTIHALPLVDEVGKLLGAYIRWNDLIYLEYLFQYNQTGHFRKWDQAYVLVKPCSIFKMKKHMFLKMKELLEAKGASVKIVENNQIAEYCSKDGKILFVDEDERRGIITLYKNLLGHTEILSGGGYTYREILDINFEQDICQLNDSMKELEKKGVHVLLLYFEENENGYYAKFQKMIQEKYDKFDGDEIKRNFFGEIYNELYENQKFGYPYSMYMEDIIPVLENTNEPLFRAYQGERLTVGQPDEYERCLYMYGPCIILGAYAEDKHTIASWLQSRMNQERIACKVVNKGIHCSPVIEWEKVISSPLKKGDIVVLYLENIIFEHISKINLIDVLEKNKVSADWVMNVPCHCNYKVNEFYANAIYEKLSSILRQPVKNRAFIKKEESIADRIYINKYFAGFDTSAYNRIGAIVMNCNPFTYGHRYLIEEALKRVEFLIIFVVEEDRSVFAFEERFAMVCEGTSDLKNVKVVPSGECILSQATFPEYFIKRADDDIVRNVENDINIFAKHIACKLNIRYRFVGEEPEDMVTNEYNSAMKRILPTYGIEVVEIPRKKNGKKIISASAVRQYLKADDKEKSEELIPESTMKILYFCND